VAPNVLACRAVVQRRALGGHDDGVEPPLELAVLDFGRFEVNEGRRLVPITGYVIVSGDRVALVDTGFPARYVDDPVGTARLEGLDAFGCVVSLTRDNLPVAQLGLAGFSPGDVTDLVITHGDVDHIGGMAGFPGATLVVGRAELELGPPRYFGSVRPVGWPTSCRYRVVDGDEELFPGVEILSTPGHSPGHLSLLVRLRRTGPILLAGDAISRPAELESGENGGAWDEELARASAARLLRIAEREGARLLFGHDWEQWSALAKAPNFYR
jgi:N-acyl homoserine lactone hydrolase